MFILPETKGITLERMDKIFGEIDYVEAGEAQAGTLKAESTAIEHVTRTEGLERRDSEKAAHGRAKEVEKL